MGGRRIIDRVAAALRPVVSSVVLVSNDPDAGGWLPGTPVMRDRRAERGGLVGVHTAIAHATDFVLVVAWDMPFVTPPLLLLIRDRALDSGLAAVPEGPRGPEPMCAAYPRGALGDADAAIDAGELTLSRFIDRLSGVARIPRTEVERIGDPARLFFNVNSPADLAAAERLAAR